MQPPAPPTGRNNTGNGSLISYMTEIHKEIGMEDTNHVIARIRSLRHSEVKMQILEEQ